MNLRDRMGDAAYEKRYGGRARDLYDIVREPPPPHNWILDGYVERPGHLILAGRAGSAKTMLALQLAVQASQELPAEFPYDTELGVPALRVALVDGEMGRLRYHRRVYETGLKEYVQPERLKHVDAAGLDLMDPSDREYVAEQCLGYDLIIMDSLKKLTRSLSENDNDQMTEIVSDISDMSKQLNVGIFTIHHRGTSDKDFRGATAILDHCDALVTWKAQNQDGKKFRCLTARGEWNKIRDGMEPEDKWYEQLESGLLIPSPGPEAEPERSDQWAEVILGKLPFEGTKAALAEACGASRSSDAWRAAYARVAVTNGSPRHHIARPDPVEQPGI